MVSLKFLSLITAPTVPLVPLVVLNMAQWWNEVVQAAAAPEDRHADPRGTQAPPLAPGGVQKSYTTLGYLKAVDHPDWRFYELQYLQFIKSTLTDHWAIIQGGHDARALDLWLKIFLALELDLKSQLDLMLLAHSGLVGRTEANFVLWEILSNWALKPEYEDLSNKLSNLVGIARRRFDRPPEFDSEGLPHRDRKWWRWKCYSVPRNIAFSPLEIPTEYKLLKGVGGEPLPPPRCWGEPDPPIGAIWRSRSGNREQM